MAKLWHDDVRPPPEGWAWAKTNNQAKLAFAYHFDWIDECSLDHDLGAQPLEGMSTKEMLYLAGSSPDGSGLDLVKWMCKHNFVPPKVTIHSWNPPGAKAMSEYLLDHVSGLVEIVVQPYEVKT